MKGAWRHALLDLLQIGDLDVKEEPESTSKTSKIPVKIDLDSDDDWQPDDAPDDDDDVRVDEPQVVREGPRLGRKKCYIKLSDGFWKCVKCDLVHRQRYMFKGHFEEVHSDSVKLSVDDLEEVEEGYVCIHCKSMSSDRDSLLKHVCRKDEKMAQNLYESCFQCGACSVIFGDALQLR